MAFCGREARGLPGQLAVAVEGNLFALGDHPPFVPLAGRLLQISDGFRASHFAAEERALAFVGQVDLIAADLLAAADIKAAVVPLLEPAPLQPQLEIAIRLLRSQMRA